MNEAKDNGGCAFPIQLQPHGCDYQLGMSLRDWFAGMAMMGLASRRGYGKFIDMTQDAYDIADLMLEVRK